jgi:YesN/AraC family two-component response regulator
MAKAYFRKALDIYQQNGSPDKVEVSLGNLGTLYQKEGKYDSALLFFRASLTIARKLERIGSIAVKLSNMGVIFYELGNFDSAIVCQSEALKISRKIGRMFPVCAALQNLGEIYLAKNDLKTARNYLEEAQTCAASVQAKTIQEKVFKSLSQLYERMGDPAKALANYKRFTALKDSMFTMQSQEKLAEMEARYLSEKKQQHIELLIKDKELRETSLRKHQLALYWVISGSLILLVSLAVISFLLKQKSKANRILVEKSIQLLQHEESNEIQAVINSSPAISDDEKSRLIAGLNKLIRHDKIFTRPQISLTDLAEHLDTNTTYLSRIINEDFQHNFPNFINRLRIQEAQKMFAEHKYKSMTLEGIAGSVGFHSRSTFNLAFKKFTGVTPSVYIANLEKLSKPA